MRLVPFRDTFLSFPIQLTSSSWSGESPNRPNSQNSLAIHQLNSTLSWQNPFSADPGLSLCGIVVYNNRQNLPLTGNLPDDSNGSSLTSEADMKPARPEQTPLPSTAMPKTSGASGTESRAERVARIRREIQNGTYESEEKLERAIERMLGVLHAE